MLQVENLTKSFGHHAVLRGASLDVRRGEVAVLIGASGCGKSTLLRCINGLEEFQGGEIAVGEHKLTAGASRAARDEQLVDVREQCLCPIQIAQVFGHQGDDQRRTSLERHFVLGVVEIERPFEFDHVDASPEQQVQELTERDRLREQVPIA